MKEQTQYRFDVENERTTVSIQGEATTCGYMPPKEKTAEGADHETIRQAVRKGYGKIARTNPGGCGCSGTPSYTSKANMKDHAAALGYSSDEINASPEGANMGLGCGNPQAIAKLVDGETVLDLGSGGGFDSFLAARAVGAKGKVIGVDMTPEMIAKARENAHKAGLNNVEFRLGEIESLPVESGTVDVIISNCVINLSPEKDRVFREAFRVLKPGGRLAVSDVVATTELPEKIKKDLAMYAGCVAGASLVDDLEAMITAAGFTQVSIKPKDESRSFIRDWAPGSNIQDFILSAVIEAVKPS